ncbi:hypothetical protein CC85DRAFT_287378 [Cutaneotrichosporon oleaginosum]|uniref:Uncharacterized protein n=1 Tax=Cutaneotrichosporon oleaginosum TaxID=879819 RepID=A0A0J0XHQ0_9TREE|nr:uncharacterized protein CC85DRAFT_287378 [Cutaneotrichosporon oleaginosum]KLT40537.1 hypothetical protein CC85DRAFT_287378 [Cutaneotrichosporon oleaginosum]TXT08392.1 hypothetical protein COLE_05316 [Cutaneotrichosporon oleaginosum]
MVALDNLQQLLYAPDGTRYLVLSRASTLWQVSMWTPAGPGHPIPRVWNGIGEAGTGERAREIADGVLAGMLSVQTRDNGGLKLLVHLSKGAVGVYLDAAQLSDSCVGDLLAAAFNMKEARPATADANSTRAHEAQIEALQAEISSLQNRNANLKAQIQRQNGSSGRKDAQPIVKPTAPPKNASVLQPTQRRRKVVEDEFMGSSGDEDDEDDDDEAYDDDD